MPYLKQTLCIAVSYTRCSDRAPDFTCTHYHESHQTPLTCAYKDRGTCLNPSAMIEAKKQLITTLTRQLKQEN
jgi:hypothetical protein